MASPIGYLDVQEYVRNAIRDRDREWCIALIGNCPIENMSKILECVNSGRAKAEWEKIQKEVQERGKLPLQVQESK
jgi:hypothetical protein